MDHSKFIKRVLDLAIEDYKEYSFLVKQTESRLKELKKKKLNSYLTIQQCRELMNENE